MQLFTETLLTDRSAAEGHDALLRTAPDMATSPPQSGSQVRSLLSLVNLRAAYFGGALWARIAGGRREIPTRRGPLAMNPQVSG